MRRKPNGPLIRDYVRDGDITTVSENSCSEMVLESALADSSGVGDHSDSSYLASHKTNLARDTEKGGQWTHLPSHQPITLVGFAARKKLCLLYTWVRRLVAESDRAQRTLNLLAGIFREHELGASATALGGRRSASSAASETYRDCQEPMDLAAASCRQNPRSRPRN